MKIDIIVTGDDGRRWFAAGVDLNPEPDPTDPPVDPPCPTILPGVHDQRAPADLVRAFPGVRLTREFVGGVQSDPNDLAGLQRKIERVVRPSLDAGLEPVVSAKFDVDQVLAGSWTDPLRQLGPWLLALGVRRFIPWHEPEDDIPGVKFARYFNLVRTCLRAGATDLSVIWSAMAYHWAPGPADRASIAGKTDDTAAWRAVEADEYAIDVYNGRSFPLDQILPEHAGFARWHAEIIGDTGRRWLVTERGFETSAAGSELRARTIAREGEWLLSPAAAGCTGYIYWSTPGAEKSTPLDLDATGENVVRALVRAVSAAGGTA